MQIDERRVFSQEKTQRVKGAQGAPLLPYLFSDEHVAGAIARADIDELATIWNKAPYVRKDVDLQQRIESAVQEIAEKNGYMYYDETFPKLVRMLDQDYVRLVRWAQDWTTLKRLMQRGPSWRRFIIERSLCSAR